MRTCVSLDEFVTSAGYGSSIGTALLRRSKTKLSVGLIAVCIAALVVIAGRPATAATQPAWLLYRSDWSGTSQIYSVDPTGKRPAAQLTSGRPPACGEAACGYGDPVPSPDGRALLFSDWASCEPASHPASVFLARADGTHRRRLARQGQFSCYPGLTGAWSPDSRQIAYQLGDRIHVVRRDGGGERILAGLRPVWRPHGGGLAFERVSNDGGRTLWVERNRRVKMVAGSLFADHFAWSPTGRWIGYTRPRLPRTSGQSDLVVVSPDGTRRRTLLTGFLHGPSWSSDGRFLTAWTVEGIAVVDVEAREKQLLPLGSVLAWRLRGHEAAIEGPDGIYLVDVATGDKRLLSSDAANEAEWSPDGTQLAYVMRERNAWPFAHGDLKIATISGRVRTVIRSEGDFGGSISALVWARPPASVRYRPAKRRTVANVSADELVAPWPVTRIATDGTTVAYASCGHVFVWTPASKRVVQTEPIASMTPSCSTPNHYVAFWIYTLALSGDRVAWGSLTGNMGQSWALGVGSATAPGDIAKLGSIQSANGCAVGAGGLGDLTGAGSLLVFSTWRDEPRCPKARTLEQRIHRVGVEGCPCPTIASALGPLAPFDVDGGRIVVGGDNATELLDSDGRRLLSVPVSPLAAQLAGSHLVLLMQGGLRDYDAASGALLHAWPLPDVPSGGECGSPHSGTWECRWDARLVLEDAARGLVAYVLDRHVRLLRLADGADAVVAAGTLARFTAEGLVYVDGKRIHLTPFESLPLTAG
jgi:Tol biopolymer transport system component